MGAVVVLRVLGLVLGGAVLVLGLAGGGIYFLSTNRLNQKIDIPTASIAIPTDITAIQRGQHLASAVAACVECHGPNLAGKVFIDDPLLARIVPPNLTRGRGGVGATFSDADFVRAIRHGVDPSGRQLLIMPSNDYNHFSDADLGAIIAYVRSLPAINTSLPANDVHVLGLILFSIGQLPLQPAATIDHRAPRPVVPASGVTADYGKYLSDSAGCPSCHGPGLSGGKMPQAQSNAVPAANITPTGLGTWSEADFIKAMRTGVRPDGIAIGPSMPWPFYAQLTDSELRAIWRFLQVVPPRPTGTR
jgi:mono/diheme cytochrome c family protein